METIFSEGIKKTPSSFIRDILKVTEDSSIISFAGGLPHPVSFPVAELQESSNRVIQDFGSNVFQYASSQGLSHLRKYIANRYQTKFGFACEEDDILITTGSQQALDLIGKVLLNKGDKIGMEMPGYLGAIQSCSYFQPEFCEISLEEDGMNLEELKGCLQKDNVKFIYTVPNFQNPTGITYSEEKRIEICKLMSSYETFLIEDDPYGDLRFEGRGLPYIGAGKLPGSILLGSISKIITPGFRLGWICTKNKTLMNQLVIAKQASDLHSNIFSQYIIWDYLIHNDLEGHIEKIRLLYQKQCTAMLAAIKEFFPQNVTSTVPQGGMFLWVTLPKTQSAIELFQRAVIKKVAFVPGDPFYVNRTGVATMRLNYTNSDLETIREGIYRLSQLISKE